MANLDQPQAYSSDAVAPGDTAYDWVASVPSSLDGPPSTPAQPQGMFPQQSLPNLNPDVIPAVQMDKYVFHELPGYTQPASDAYPQGN